MTDIAELAGALERLVLAQLLDPATAVVTYPVPDDTTEADLDEARGITRQRLCQVDLAQQLDDATLETGMVTSDTGLQTVMMLRWEIQAMTELDPDFEAHRRCTELVLAAVPL